MKRTSDFSVPSSVVIHSGEQRLGNSSSVRGDDACRLHVRAVMTGRVLSTLPVNRPYE